MMQTDTAPRTTRPLNILLIEDDDNHAALVERVFRSMQPPATLTRMCDGADALRHLTSRRQRPDLILLDLKLPGLSGHDVIAQLKADPTLRAIPVVVLTTSDTQRDRQQALSNHANSYLVKPLDFERFKEMLNTLVAYWGRWNIRLH